MDVMNPNTLNKQFPFSVRVYGLLSYKKKLLISEEFWHETHMIKFPGGGLEYGEGLIECLKREFLEELKLEIIKTEFLMIPDAFIPAIIYTGVQVLPIYYKVAVDHPSSINCVQHFMNPKERENGAQQFHWIAANESLLKMLSFEGDKSALEHYIKLNNL